MEGRIEMRMKKNTFLHCSLIIVLCSLIMACGDKGGGGSATPPSADPALTGTVSISGTAEVGETLTAVTSALGGSGTISYQWKRNTSSGTTTNIGTNSGTYPIVQADTGFTITVTVTRAGYTGSKTSEATAIVIDPDAPPLTGTVSISGTAEVDATLTAVITELGGEGTINYQWKRNPSSGTAVNIGTNLSTYVVVSADIGSTITVTVTRTGNSSSVTSDPTDIVPDPNLPPGTLTISIGTEGDVSIDDPDSLIVDGVLTLSRDDEPVILTLADYEQYDIGSIRWSVQNTAITGSQYEFELDPANPGYFSGIIYFLTVHALRNGVPYDFTISFKVEEE
jgi:hypothetical protein